MSGDFMKANNKGISLGAYIREKRKDEEFSVAYEEASMHLRIARLIEELRQKDGLTQAELAKRAGVSQPMIARLEAGDPRRVPTLSTVSKVFRALGYEIDLQIRQIAA